MEKSLEQLFLEFKQLPDWDRFPMPEIFYKHFNVKKPQPASVSELVNYCPPPALSLGKTEVRKPLEGGVRQIEELPPLPVSVEVLQDVDDFIPEAKIYEIGDVSGATIIYKPANQEVSDIAKFAINGIIRENAKEVLSDSKINNLSAFYPTNQNDDDKKQDSGQNLSNLPTEYSSLENQHESGHQSPSPYDASLCTFGDAPCPDAECSPASQKPQSQHSSLAQYQTETPLSISFQA